MGFLDTVKGVFSKSSQQRQQKTLPPPPMGNLGAPYSEEIVPPPKVTDFDEEIPELPDLEIPEGVEGSPRVSVPTPPIPRPKSKVVPPPQGQETLDEVPGETEPEWGDVNISDISFQKIETSKLKNPEPVETKPHFPVISEPVQLTYVSSGQEYIREFAFMHIMKNLKEVQTSVSGSKHSGKLSRLDEQRQAAVGEFRKELKTIFETLEEIDKIAFKR